MGFPILKIILACLNFCLLSFLVVLMLDHCRAANNITSWASGFHVLSLSWLLIRGVFLLLTITSNKEWTALQFYVLYWTPEPLEFGSFMLVPLFFGQVLYSEIWKTYSWLILPIYSVIVISLIVFMVTWAVLAAMAQDQRPCDDPLIDRSDLPDRCFKQEYSSDAFRIASACCYLTLGIFQGLFIYKLSTAAVRQQSRNYERFFSMDMTSIKIVMFVLALSFLSQGVYQMLTVFPWFDNKIPRITLQGDTDLPIVVFLALLFWDYLPTVLLVLAFTSRTLINKFNKMRTKNQGKINFNSLNENRSSFDYDYAYAYDNSQDMELGRINMNDRSSLLGDGRNGSDNKAVSGLLFDYSSIESPANLTPPASALSGSRKVFADSQRYWCGDGARPGLGGEIAASSPFGGAGAGAGAGAERGMAYYQRRKRSESLSETESYPRSELSPLIVSGQKHLNMTSPTTSNMNMNQSHGQLAHHSQQPSSMMGMGPMLFGNNSAVLNAKARGPERIDPFPRNPGDVANLSEEDLMRSTLDRKSSMSSRRDAGGFMGISAGSEGLNSPAKPSIVEQLDDA